MTLNLPSEYTGVVQFPVYLAHDDEFDRYLDHTSIRKLFGDIADVFLRDGTAHIVIGPLAIRDDIDEQQGLVTRTYRVGLHPVQQNPVSVLVQNYRVHDYRWTLWDRLRFLFSNRVPSQLSINPDAAIAWYAIEMVQPETDGYYWVADGGAVSLGHWEHAARRFRNVARMGSDVLQHANYLSGVSCWAELHTPVGPWLSGELVHA